jgi:nitrogen fixation NifU-like protein
MAYSDKVIDHYNNPRNVGSFDKARTNVGTGVVGAPECGDVMKLQIEVEGDRIVDAKFKTFGCGSAIASSSLATEWIKGKTIDEAMAIRNTQIVAAVRKLRAMSPLYELASEGVDMMKVDWERH